MRIIPAIDIIDGKVVRLSEGDYNRATTYNDDPVETAKQFEDYGITHLHLVDLDGARSQGIVNYKVLEKICKATNLKVDFGGGIKSDKDIQIAFESGATQVTGGSIAIKNPELFKSWIDKYGSERIILGADSKNRKIATNGWLETSDSDVVDFIQQYQSEGVEYVICTDITKDGMLNGPAFELYEEIISATNVKLIASGGVSNVGDLIRLKKLGCEGAIVGKALYEGQISLNQLQELC